MAFGFAAVCYIIALILTAFLIFFVIFHVRIHAFIAPRVFTGAVRTWNVKIGPCRTRNVCGIVQNC